MCFCPLSTCGLQAIFYQDAAETDSVICLQFRPLDKGHVTDFRWSKRRACPRSIPVMYPAPPCHRPKADTSPPMRNPLDRFSPSGHASSTATVPPRNVPASSQLSRGFRQQFTIMTFRTKTLPCGHCSVVSPLGILHLVLSVADIRLGRVPKSNKSGLW